MTTITKEEVKAFIEQIESDLANGWEAQIFELKLARIALASLEAEPVAWTSEGALAEVYCGETGVIGPKYIVGDVSLYRHAQPVSVDKEFIPKNLDKALGVVGVALPESKEEFNFQIERWIQRLIDRVIRYADEFKEQPVPVVPDEWTIQDAVKFCRETGRQDAGSAMEAWNACRAAMLQGVEQPQNARQNIPENIPDGNSPAIPDDWVMVPKEPTQAMIKAWLSEVANWRGHVAGYKAALAAAPQHEVK
ncbi:DUF551 domain-containing protein [Salmonella enterica subsp. enterica serovar Kentucky]|nr:DUF551 domain-containing protein [Salmonella enterica subsp. enterica serovar Corvallis]EBX8530871.1 DUF551 domain-containing protein [Salmonella enterica subsp. enterica serovar Agona]ECH8652902.1 DUF551 domain-containing protein [Salmonella enterica subsp. enterica serovar Agona]ECO1463996.1 DUF551 domain-containing protein [Salmonella enterica subsp. enterica serovar Kentucky]HBI5387722.1 DUF551 domain-containing protein [Salmonella enterica]